MRVITRLAAWRGEAKLTTWAYRVGVNYLLNLRRGSSAEATSLSFDEFRDGLAEGLADADYRGPEAQVLADEMRLSCTQAMLQCLERHERIAFVLGEIFELTSADAAWILDTTPAAFRKRLQRARTRIRRVHGIHLRPGQPSMRSAAVPGGSHRGSPWVASTPNRPAFVTHPVSASGRDVAQAAAQFATLHNAAAVLRAHPDYGRASIEGRRDRDVAAVRAIPAAGVISPHAPAEGGSIRLPIRRRASTRRASPRDSEAEDRTRESGTLAHTSLSAASEPACAEALAYVVKVSLGCRQRIEVSTPPSARRAAPFVAEDSGLARNRARLAISRGSMNRWGSVV